MSERRLVDQPSNLPTRKVGSLLIVLVLTNLVTRLSIDVDSETVATVADFVEVLVAGGVAYFVKNRAT